MPDGGLEDGPCVYRKDVGTVKHRRVLVIAGLIGALALIVSLSVAAGSTGKTHRQSAAAIRAAVNPPPVANAKAIRAKYGGQKITFIGDQIGLTHERDLKFVARFQKDTGIKVKLIAHPKASTDSYAQLARAFSAHSSSVDVAMIDVIWPGAFAPFLVDLKPKLGKLATKHVQSIVQNGTIGGKMIAMPWFSDYGILYYRTDLLKKYGYSHPPRTWNELGSMAKKIQAGERKNNDNFYGYVFQGKATEALTCDALEWIASSGGGHYFDGGKASIDNEKAAAILNTVRSWVGNIAPRGVTTYEETESLNVFDSGNAAFLRNWPYAYSVSQGADSKIKGQFNVTVLPHSGKNASVATIGGWELAVSKYSKHKGAAIELVRYLTSPAAERFTAIFSSNPPTIPSVATDKAVVKVNPWLKPEIAKVGRVARPSRFLKGKYQQGSAIIFQGVNQILNGQNAKSVLPGVESRLNRLVK
jgi:trehalose/maltose transport system substrate-binding protein